MNYWGNDIVALDDPDFQTEDRIDRWIEKVCTVKETDYLVASDQKNVDRWQLWSCKESVYKVLIKKGVAPFLNAKRIEIFCGESTDEGVQSFTATFEEEMLFGISIRNEHWVHSICCDFPIEGQTYHSEIINTEADTASQEVRFRIKEVLEKNHQLPINNIIQSESNVPTVVCTDANMGVDLSLSHHAPYSAYLFQIHQK